MLNVVPPFRRLSVIMEFITRIYYCRGETRTRVTCDNLMGHKLIPGEKASASNLADRQTLVNFRSNNVGLIYN